MSQKQKVLIIDDEEDICRFTRSALEKTKRYEVIFATNALEGIALARDQLPGLILLDVNMPEMDGGDVAASLASEESTRDIPLVFVTALISKNEIGERPTSIGGHLFIAKPLTPKMLVERVDSILRVGQQPKQDEAAGVKNA